MLKSRLLIFLLLLVSGQGLAFKCFYTLVKPDCWAGYEVTVEVSDAVTNEQVLTVTVPKGKLWVRKEFTCEAGQKFMYNATFTPVIWEKDEGKIYHAQRFWTLPAQIQADTKAWNIPVCFPSAFAEVPLPPDATSNCLCDFAAVPEVKPL